MLVEILLDVDEGVGVDDALLELGVEAADALLEGSVLGFGVATVACECVLCRSRAGEFREHVMLFVPSYDSELT